MSGNGQKSWQDVMDLRQNRRRAERESCGTQVTQEDLEAALDAELLNPESVYENWIKKKVEKTSKKYPNLLVKAVIPPPASETDESEYEYGAEAIKYRPGQYRLKAKGPEPKKPRYI